METPCRPTSGAIVVDSSRGIEDCLDDALKQLDFLAQETFESRGIGETED